MAWIRESGKYDTIQFMKWAQEQPDKKYNDIFTQYCHAQFDTRFKKMAMLVLREINGDSWVTALDSMEKKLMEEEHNYCTVEEGVAGIMSFCRVNKINLRDFLIDIEAIMNKTRIKQNTPIFFGGGANAGKSWIARGIADAFVNRALIIGGDGSCCFLMEPAINKRVALVEEVMISEQATEMFSARWKVLLPV